ncbi:hypothetical protein Taro_005038, partial [Colocasia esculenta]|nr:hypothetical protein [Colocasia esculenta]
LRRSPPPAISPCRPRLHLLLRRSPRAGRVFTSSSGDLPAPATSSSGDFLLRTISQSPPRRLRPPPGDLLLLQLSPTGSAGDFEEAYQETLIDVHVRGDVFDVDIVENINMASDGGSYSGSRPRRQRTTMQQTFPTHAPSEGSVVASSEIGSVTGPVSAQIWGRGHGRRGPSRGLTDRRLESGQRWNVKVIGGTGIGESGAQFVSHMGIVSKLHCKIWQKDFVKLPTDIIDTIFRDLENIVDRNKTNRSHQSMPYRKGRKSHYQLKDDFRLAHDREPNRVEIFKIGGCKELPDGNEQWVDDESRSRYERMIQLSTPSLDSESGSTPIFVEEAFVSVMGKDRSGRIRCGGSRETRRTWYGT